MRKIAAYVFAFSMLSAAVSGCGKVEENLDAGSADGITSAVITAEVNDEDEEPAEEENEDVTDEDDVKTPETTVVTAAVTEPEVTTVAVSTAAQVYTPSSYEEDDDDDDDYYTPPAVQSTQKPKETEKPAPEETEATPAPVYEEPEVEVEPTYINGILIANKTYALPKNYAPGGLTSDTQAAFNAMNADASEEGLNLWVASGFRSYELQDSLYERYAARDGYAAADRYSARPGHSEHQTGLAFDLNTIDSSFEYTAEGAWVAENCYKYGFIIRYPKGKESVTGYMYEPWHLRYLGVDLATDVYNSGLCLEEYLGITSQYAD